jgi:hypothetical protein
VFQKQSQPFGMFEAARFGLGIEVLEAFGHAVETEILQQVKRGVGQHAGFSFQWK